MLIFTLEENDQVFIGKGIRIKLVKVKGGKVELGFEVSGEVTFTQEELILHGNAETLEQIENFTSQSMIQILEEEDPKLAELIKKKK
jgi:sRNA-binding carbon storage regulator CsrA